MSTFNALAIDCGSSSVKAVCGSFSKDNELKYETIYSQDHRIIDRDGSLLWDLPALIDSIKKAISIAQDKFEGRLDSIAIDTWGVDYAWIDKNGETLTPIFSYRDQRGEKGMKIIGESLSNQDFWEQTGTQMASILTCCQIASSEIPEEAQLVMLPNYLSGLLTGKFEISRAIASTSGLLNTRTGEWALPVLQACGITLANLPALVEEGTIAGEYENAKVIYAGSHDTSCALYALNEISYHDAFISCGSWSLVGMITEQAILNGIAKDYGLTNESCTDGRNRLLKNMTGTWLLQETQRYFESKGTFYSYSEMGAMAAQATLPEFVLDPNLSCLAIPTNLPERIVSICRQLGLPVPTEPGDLIKLLVTSLACAHAQTIKTLEESTGVQIKKIFLIGGGSQDRLLCQMTADASGKTVIAGPVHASALGSLRAQFETLKQTKISIPYQTTTYQPQLEQSLLADLPTITENCLKGVTL